MRKAVTTSFRERVIATVRSIPAGETRTYGEVAREAGNAQAARAVGAIMRSNNDPAVPCHRVITRHGAPGGYNRGTAEKVRRLQAEGALYWTYDR